MNTTSTELRVIDAQFAWIKKECGAKAADQANYGWGVEISGKNVVVNTKVYGHGVLTSTGTYRVRRIDHSWETR
jgi:hypothetical protein